MIYLDNAATTYPKPPSVYKAVDSCLRRICGSPGRGGHRMSLAAGRAVWDCRVALSDFFNVGAPENVCFTMNCTYALNIAVKGLIKPYSRVITSNLEHNSVMRPLYSIPSLRIETFNALLPEDEMLTQISKLLYRGADTLICLHASNILHVVLPIEKIGRLCRESGVRFIVDAAQSAGIYPIDMSTDKIDILCMPAHKALYGIQGAGVIIFSKDMKYDNIPPLISGGSGMESKSKIMPNILPERFEAGTLSTPAISALCEGVKFINSVGMRKIREHEQALAERFSEILSQNEKIILYGNTVGNPILFNVDGVDCETVARYADEHGICVRAGLHCSPCAHKANTTLDTGAIRASFSYLNTIRDAEKAANAFLELT